jgi:hypothetical protein
MTDVSIDLITIQSSQHTRRIELLLLSGRLVNIPDGIAVFTRLTMQEPQLLQ